MDMKLHNIDSAKNSLVDISRILIEFKTTMKLIFTKAGSSRRCTQSIVSAQAYAL